MFIQVVSLFHSLDSKFLIKMFFKRKRLLALCGLGGGGHSLGVVFFNEQLTVGQQVALSLAYSSPVLGFRLNMKLCTMRKIGKKNRHQSRTPP